MSSSDWKDFLVEIFVPTEGGKGLIATGYPVAPDRILTAGHVLDHVTDETQIKVRWYHQEGPAREWRTINGIAWRGGEDLDATLLDCPFPEGVHAAASLSARRPRDDMRWASEGFMRAGKRGDRRDPVSLQGGVHSKASRSPWFDLGVDYPPSGPQDFKGASGSPVVVGNAIIGVIQSCPENFFGNKLHAVPVWRLLEETNFGREVQRDTAHVGKVLKDVHKMIGASHAIVEKLGDRLDIPEEGAPVTWTEEIAKTLLNLPCSDVITVLDELHKVGCEDNSDNIVDICIQLVNLILPVTFDLKTVTEAMDRIKQGEAMLVGLPVVNHSCAEIIMAGVDSRPTEFESTSGTFEFPPGKLTLPDPPEIGMDSTGKDFQRAWVDFLIEKFVSADDWQLFHSDQKLARQTVIARAAKEIAYRASYLKRTHYYVYRYSLDRDRLGNLLTSLKNIKNSFPALVFINLCDESEISDEYGFTFHILRDMYLRHQTKPKE